MPRSALLLLVLDGFQTGAVKGRDTVYVATEEYQLQYQSPTSTLVALFLGIVIEARILSPYRTFLHVTAVQQIHRLPGPGELCKVRAGAAQPSARRP